MQKTNEEVLEAVHALDPQNDEHWTADGQPRLDAVENMLGGDVSRKQVTNAAPDFTRSVAQDLVDAPKDGEPPVDEPPVEGVDKTLAGDDVSEVAEAKAEAVPQSPEPTDETDEAAAGNDDTDKDDPLAEGPADLEAELDAEVTAQRERIEEIRQGLEKGKVMLGEEEAELARMIDEKNRAFPPMSQAEAIKRFQRNELAKRAAARGAGLGTSPLDVAMKAARKPRRQGQIG